MKFGEILSSLRNEAKITQKDLANILGVSRGTIGMYEIGQRDPDTETLKKLAKFFNVSIDYLIGLTTIKDVSPIIKQKNTEKPVSELNEKDERDIKKDLIKTLEQLEGSQDGLMFDGEPMDDETRELLKISLENSMRIAKQVAKKYTPKKYKK